jgi:hypothetical protein
LLWFMREILHLNGCVFLTKLKTYQLSSKIRLTLLQLLYKPSFQPGTLSLFWAKLR